MLQLDQSMKEEKEENEYSDSKSSQRKSSDDESLDKSNSLEEASPYTSNGKKEEVFEIKKLTWEDYQGIPDDDDPAIAHTKWKIGYNYTLKQIAETNEFQVEVDVWCKVDPSSWVKTKFIELLNHEQGHYYIGGICALEFKKKVQNYQFTQNHKNEISTIFNENLKKHLEMERQYDIETLNMLNTTKQKSWDNLLLKNLSDLQKNT